MALRRVLGYNKRAAARRDQAPVSKPDSLTQTNRNLSVKPSAENGGNRADPLAICHRYFSSAHAFSFGIFSEFGQNKQRNSSSLVLLFVGLRPFLFFEMYVTIQLSIDIGTNFKRNAVQTVGVNLRKVGKVHRLVLLQTCYNRIVS